MKRDAPRDQVLVGDCVASLEAQPAGFAQTCVTSFPYWGLRDYGVHADPAAVGLEPTLDDHLDNCVKVGRAIRRALRPDGTLWLNYGDAYAGSWGAQGRTGQTAGRSVISARQIAGAPKGLRRTGARSTDSGFKPKDLMGLAWRVAFALQDDGWWLRSDVVWHKPNAMPESITDRPARAHEYVFLMAPSERYFYDAEAVKVKASAATNPRRKAFAWVPKGDAARAAIGRTEPRAKQDGHGRRHDGFNARYDAKLAEGRGRGDFNEATDAGVLPRRNLRDVWEIPSQPYRGAHFATFPEALVEPCVKAGTSQAGQCPSCGAPWRRNVERKEYGDMNPRAVDPANLVKRWNQDSANLWRDGGYVPPRTTGWEPSCRCGAGDPVPQIVLDPFGGSGTTGLVAKRLGRDFTLCELNPTYAEMARRRLSPAMNRRLNDYRTPETTT